MCYNGGRTGVPCAFRRRTGQSRPGRDKEPEMDNMEMTVEGDTLTIVVNLKQDLGLSKSGKTRIIATSRGNAKIPGSDATIGLNVYRKV